MKSGIYMLFDSATEQFYIGSSKALSARRNYHFSQLRRDKHPNSYLQRVFNKRGESLSFVVLANCPIEYLIRLEQWFINALKPTYNLSKIAANNIVKIIDKSKPFTRKMDGTNNPFWGKSHSPEFISKLHSGNEIEVKCYTLQNEYIATYPSMIKAAKELGFNSSENIRVCVAGKTKSAYGFIWRK